MKFKPVTNQKSVTEYGIQYVLSRVFGKNPKLQKIYQHSVVFSKLDLLNLRNPRLHMADELRRVRRELRHVMDMVKGGAA